MWEEIYLDSALDLFQYNIQYKTACIHAGGFSVQQGLKHCKSVLLRNIACFPGRTCA